ncbi:DUF4142 domain-containing protein [Luteibacter sp. PPL201]|uniref:DUF4142 domain-containing protein n=1 Tax=Luteibacter sahnii TaxID=3021977 RepID=A0ABT6BAU3_9GAMM|nr:DUF4142 domain-containing protein [Luteibacter sp. PPL193]MDY1547720.1 DUF4142 domain-containing protein [Luteibacter sp. PPL193]
MRPRLSSCLIVASLSLGTATAIVAQDTPNAQSSTSIGAATHPPGSDKPDATFVKMASASGLAEVALGKMGAAQGGSSAVKDFGQRMVADHTAANQQLIAIASRKGVPVSQQPLPADTSAAAKMQQKSGADFDKDFKKRMVMDHEKAVALFEKEASSGDDTELKAFATQTLPTLRHHLEMAKQLPDGKGYR